MKIRMHRGGLAEAMTTVREIPNSLDAVKNYLKEKLGNYPPGIEEKINSKLKIELYLKVPDERIGWDKTYLVLVDGKPYAMCDSSLTKSSIEEEERPVSTVTITRVEEIDPGHVYRELEGDQGIQFIKRKDGKLIHGGATNEGLLEILILRTNYLNQLFPCVENNAAIAAMKYALEMFESRTTKRVAQGVETKDKAHVS